MKLCVIGTGYVGLVGAAIFADWGNEVVGVDIDEEKIKMIVSGKMPIYEPGLKEIVLDNIKEKRLTFTNSLKKGIKEAEVVFICVGTPQSKSGAADLSYVWDVAAEIGKNLNGEYKVIVTKSTVPVGTNERVKEIIKQNAPKGAKFDVASNPEFLREGTSVEDMRNTDRTIVGVDSKRAEKVMIKLFSHLDSPTVICDLRSAEMIKYASNAFLATKISFVNEMAQLCEKAGADIQKVAYGMGLDKRIGSKFLNAGIGYGGSCFPKDVAALRRTSLDFAYDFSLVAGVMDVNDAQWRAFTDKILSAMGENLEGKTIACLGLAFKSDTDDIRESVAIKIIQTLRGHGAKIKAYDPVATKNAKLKLGSTNITYSANMYDAIKDADALCILTEWEEFRNLDLQRIKKSMKKKNIFDGRLMLDQEAVENEGFAYYTIGKRTKAYVPEYKYSNVILNGHNGK